MSGKAIRIKDVRFSFEVQQPEAEFSFGAAVAGALTFAHARVLIEDARGKTAFGWGAILLSYPWAFPSSQLSETQRDQAMRSILEIAGAKMLTQDPGHPIDHFRMLQKQFTDIEATVSEDFVVGASIPRLATLVAVSPLDAAVHDAYGRLHRRSSFEVLSPEYTGWQLRDILGPQYSNTTLTSGFRDNPVDELVVYHTVGGSDVIDSDDETSLANWIRRDGVFAFKVKLKGQHLDWDIKRLLDVYRLGHAIHGRRVRMFADLNEQAPNITYIEDLLSSLNEVEPDILGAIDAIEQPDQRDMGDKAMDFNALLPHVTVALDEGLISLDSIERAHALGYRGLCLKTCKTQSLMLLALATAMNNGMSVTVQDLTNPGIALHQSLGLASRLRTIMPVETNQRQFYPHASTPEMAAWPTLYRVRNGKVDVREIRGSGFGFTPEAIRREIFSV